MKNALLSLFLLLCCGCANHRARVVITRVDGEPSISFEFEEKETRVNNKSRKQLNSNNN
jgi:hypothetical protein